MGAPESSTTRASDLVPSGAPDQKIGGLSPVPWQVNRAGMTPPVNSGLLTDMSRGASALRGCGLPSSPQPVSTSALAAMTASRAAAGRRRSSALRRTLVLSLLVSGRALAAGRSLRRGRHGVPASSASLVRLTRGSEHDLVPGRHRRAPWPTRLLRRPRRFLRAVRSRDAGRYFSLVPRGRRISPARLADRPGSECRLTAAGRSTPALEVTARVRVASVLAFADGRDRS